ncbi:MAG: YfhO family protein [Lachnospiraceae bacterium]|nr:YfhO family protein [Lachnospiraceae bacterium]
MKNQQDSTLIKLVMCAVGVFLGVATVVNIFFHKVDMMVLFWGYVALVIIGLGIYLLNEKNSSSRRMNCLALVGMTILASLPSFTSFSLFGHDIEFHLNRLCAVAEELKNMQFPVRMQSTTMNGYGYATSLFYSDLFLYIPAAMIAIGLPVYLCYNFYVVSVTFFTLFVAYKSFNGIFKNDKIAMTGSFLYTVSAYRLINVYIRAAMGEYTAMIFLPLVLWGIWNFIDVKGKLTVKDYLPLVFGITGLVECHILSCEMVAEFGVLFVLFNIKRFINKDSLIAFGKVIMWCVGLNAYFVVPFLSSYGMDLDVKTRELEAVGSSTLYPLQMFNVFVEYSTKAGIVGPIGGMPMAVGGALLIGVVGMIIFVMHREQWGLRNIKAYVYGRKLLVYSIIALFLVSSWFPWKYMHYMGATLHRLLCQVQFSWRYLGIATVLLVTLFLCVLKVLWEKEKIKEAILLAGIVMGISTITVTYMFVGAFNNGKAVYAYTYDDVGNDNIGWKEYVLEGTDTDKYTEANWATVSENSESENKQINVNRGVRSVDIKTSSAAKVTFSIMAYDNYVAYDKDTKTEYEIVKNEDNLIEVSLPEAYDGTLVVEYKEPITWRISEVITLLTIIGLAFSILKMNKKKEA